MQTLEFQLPLPPSLNNCYRNVKINLRIMTPEARNWKLAAQALAMLAMKKQGWKKTEKEKVVVEQKFFWPDARKRDCSNCEKILSDSLNGIVFDDDCWLLNRVMDFEIDRENPRVELKIYRKENGA